MGSFYTVCERSRQIRRLRKLEKRSQAKGQKITSRKEVACTEILDEDLSMKESAEIAAREVINRANEQARRILADAERIHDEYESQLSDLEEKRKSYRLDLERAESALQKRNQTITNLVNALNKKKKAVYQRHHDNPGRIKRTAKPIEKALAEAAELGFEVDI